MTRRSLLLGMGGIVLASGAANLTSCGGGSVDPSPTDQQTATDTAILTQSRTMINELVTRWGGPLQAANDTVLALPTDLAGLRPTATALHLRQLQELNGPAPSHTGAPAAAASLQRDEGKTATWMLSKVAAASPIVAVALTQIAGCCAVLADALVSSSGQRLGPLLPHSPSKGASMNATALSGIRNVVAAENASCYVYGVLTARSGSAVARQRWEAHQAQREQYVALLVAGGGEPPAAEIAYQLPADDAATVGAHAERSAWAALVAAVASTNGEIRTQVAAHAIATARSATTWDHRVFV